jgi:hypothetical protein
MMWDVVMDAVKDVTAADPTLGPIFGGNYRKAGVSDLVVPVIEWTLLGDTETELWAPMLVQFDCWTHLAAEARSAERALRALFHSNTSTALGGFTLFTEYAGGGDLATPNRAGFTGRAVRFQMIPLRQQYAQPSALLP